MRNIFRLGLICLLLTGCRDEFQIVLPAEPGLEYNIVSELSPSDVVDVRFSENVSIGETFDKIDLRDAVITFSGLDVPGGTLPMTFDPTSEKYSLIREDFRVTEGSEYTLRIEVPNDPIDTIIATTQIPHAVGFTPTFVSSTKIPIDSVFSHHEIEVILNFDQPLNRPVYYRFVPYRLESVVRINNGGIDVINFGTRTLLEVVSIETGGNAVESFTHVDGVTIDESRLNDSSIRLLLRTIKPLMDGVSVLAQDGRDRILRLHLELVTITPELYAYDRFIDRVNRGQGGGVSSPEVTNIENATGVFGGSSRTITFLDVK